MRKIGMVMFVLAMFCFSNSYGQIRAGAGLVFGTLTDDIGINFNGEYNFDENWSGATNVSIFFVEDPPGGSAGLWTLNFDGHYYFQGNSSGPYALAGINIATATFESDFFGVEIDGSDTEVGLNIGGGYLYDTGGPWSPFGDIKYVIGNADQLVIRAGVKYTFQ